MDLQHLIVAALVPVCTLYALWLVVPGGWRRSTAQLLLRLRLPGPITSRLRRAAATGGGCACDGCDSPAIKPTTESDTAVPITIHRRR